MSVYFIGCLHLGHESIAKHRGFNNSYEHDETIINSWNSIITKRDLVFILGDVTMEKVEHYHQLDRLKGRKIVVLGNHDLPKHTRQLLMHVESVAGMIDYKGFALTHCPIHSSEIEGYRGNIHAHIHHVNKLQELLVLERYADNENQIKTLSKYYCVDAHLIQYKPKTIEQLLNKKL